MEEMNRLRCNLDGGDLRAGRARPRIIIMTELSVSEIVVLGVPLCETECVRWSASNLGGGGII